MLIDLAYPAPDSQYAAADLLASISPSLYQKPEPAKKPAGASIIHSAAPAAPAALAHETFSPQGTAKVAQSALAPSVSLDEADIAGLMEGGYLREEVVNALTTQGGYKKAEKYLVIITTF